MGGVPEYVPWLSTDTQQQQPRPRVYASFFVSCLYASGNQEGGVKNNDCMPTERGRVVAWVGRRCAYAR